MDITEILEQHKIWLESSRREGSRANLNGANLRNADLRNADLSNADLSGTNLRYANLRSAILRRTNLRRADLSDTNLSGADLSGADLLGADLSGADLPESTYIVFGESYFISITNGNYLTAGCQSHAIIDWRKFSKKKIVEMDGRDALRFYPRLLDIIDFYCGKGDRPEWLAERCDDEK